MKINSDSLDYKSFKSMIEDRDTEQEGSIFRENLSSSRMQVELENNSYLYWNEIDLNSEMEEYDSLRALDRIHHQIKITESIFINKEKPLRRLMNYATRVAAILLIPIMIIAMLLYNKISRHSEALSYCTIYAPIGTRTTFSLPDGSTGWINGGSSIKFESSFAEKTRNIDLTGEAYFNVIKNKEKAFIVKTSNIDVKVYGTTFNVMAFSDDELTEVTLERGTVEVFKKSNNKIESIGILKPEQSCIYNHILNSQIIVPVKAAERIAWKEGILVFKYEPFKEVVRRINRWYNVNIIIKDKILESYIYYGTFKDESLDEVLKLLKLTAPIGYKDLGRVRNADKSFEKRKIEIFFRNRNKLNANDF